MKKANNKTFNERSNIKTGIIVKLEELTSVKSGISSTLEEQDRHVLKHDTCQPTIFIYIQFLLLFLFKIIALKSFL